MVKIKTELEQKIYLLDSLQDVMNAVNENGGEITVDTPYDEYGNCVRDVLREHKGSFDSEAQELTLYNSYVTNRIQNSSLSDEAKTTYLTAIGDDDSVFDMTTDVSSEFGIEGANFWAFLSSTNILLTVNKTTPTNMNFIVTDNSLNVADWDSFAEILSLEGTETTPEEAQETFGEYVVDDSLMTISGTLGSFSVEI